MKKTIFTYFLIFILGFLVLAFIASLFELIMGLVLIVSHNSSNQPIILTLAFLVIEAFIIIKLKDKIYGKKN